MEPQDIIKVLGTLLTGGALYAVLDYLIKRRTTELSEGEFGLKVMKTVIETLQGRVAVLEAVEKAQEEEIKTLRREHAEEIKKVRRELADERTERRTLEAEVERLRSEVSGT